MSENEKKTEDKQAKSKSFGFVKMNRGAFMLDKESRTETKTNMGTRAVSYKANLPLLKMPVRIWAFNEEDIATMDAYAANGIPMKRLLRVRSGNNASNGRNLIYWQLDKEAYAPIYGNVLKFGQRDKKTPEGEKFAVPATEAFVQGYINYASVVHNKETGEVLYKVLINANKLNIDIFLPESSFTLAIKETLDQAVAITEANKDKEKEEKESMPIGMVCEMRFRMPKEDADLREKERGVVGHVYDVKKLYILKNNHSDVDADSETAAVMESATVEPEAKATEKAKKRTQPKA